MDFEVRAACDGDADGMSRVILWALRHTNAKDYPSHVIERIGLSFTPATMLELLGKRRVFVAVTADRIVGTASLDGNLVRTVFIAPDMQRRGIGRLLMAEIDQAARRAGLDVLTVPSSVTAEGFYSRLGFRAVRDHYHGDERTIIMERDLHRS